MTRPAALLLAFAVAGCSGSAEEAPPAPDQPPILTLTEPLDETVATPEVRVTASCTDDRGDCTLSVVVDDTFGTTLQVSELGNELSREFDLSDFDGQTVFLDVIAIDGTQAASLSRRIHVEASPDLANERTFPLPVIDFDGRRALLRTGAGLTIVEAASGIEENVEVAGFFVIQDAYLTPTGAAYAGLIEDGAPARAYDWNRSLLVELGASGSIVVAGDYAVWRDENTYELVRRQFSTMTNLHVQDSVSFGQSVASNGVVVFSESTSFEARDQIVKFDGGIYTTLTADADRDNRSPRTDGQGVVYYKTPDNDVYEIAFHDGTDETILTGPRGHPVPQADNDYAIAGGWVAFIEYPDPIRTRVWTRDPSGTLLQRAAFDGDSRIEALAADGEVMVATREARYLSRPTGELTRLSSETGWSTSIGDTWYVIIGRSVFEVR